MELVPMKASEPPPGPSSSPALKSASNPALRSAPNSAPRSASSSALRSTSSPALGPASNPAPGPSSNPAPQAESAQATTTFSQISERIRSCLSCASEELLPEIFTDEEIEEYMAITYLTKEEILRAYANFCNMEPQFFQGSKNPFLPRAKVLEMPEFKVNPFKERMVDCFSTYSDFMTFEDYLEMMSVFSESAPLELKAEYAFKLYDFDLDDMISIDDLVRLIKILKGNREMEESEMKEAAVKALIDGDVDEDGYLAFTEFAHLLSRIQDDFKSSFTIRL